MIGPRSLAVIAAALALGFGCSSASEGEDSTRQELTLAYATCPSSGVASLVPGAIPGQLVPAPCVPSRGAGFVAIDAVGLGDGVTYSSFLYQPTAAESVAVFLLEIDLEEAVLQATLPEHRGQTTSDFGAAYSCDAAINAPRFRHVCRDSATCEQAYDLWGWGWGGSSDRHHAGQSWEGFDLYRQEWYQQEPCGDHDSAYYFATVGGVPEIGKSFAENAPAWGERYQSGPDFPSADLLVTDWWRLVWDGEHVATPSALEPRCEGGDDRNWARTARTAVGIRGDGIVVFVVAEMAGSSVGLTIPELADLMLSERVDARRAMALDGGGSSAMFLRNSGLVNQPKNFGPERAVAMHLGVNCTRKSARAGRVMCEECQ